jgi:hypothetical protein
LFIAGSWMKAEGKKNPAPLSVRGSLGVFRFFSSYLDMPSARTSVGNQQYGYEGNQQRAASPQQAVNRQQTVEFGGAAAVIAMRHGADAKTRLLKMSIVSCERCAFNARQRARIWH